MLAFMASVGSITEWLGGLQLGEATAAQQLWNRYSEQLTTAARLRLGQSCRSVADEEDVALSVFRVICLGAAKGRLTDVKSRDELWWLLLSITKQKSIDAIRRAAAGRRGNGRVVQESALHPPADTSGEFSLDQLAGDDPTPDFLVALDEEFSRLLTLLRDDQLRQVAILRIEGYTVPEIAEKLAIAVRSVERKLQLIREHWKRELFGENQLP
jgi:RNA polymerase sigma factor (sigma-70 family)